MEQALHKVLTVDDDRVALARHRGYLERSGFEVWSASSASEALEILDRRGFPHVILLDVNMPDMNGIDLGRRIQAICDVPIVMLSAVEESATKADCIDDFCEDFVSKTANPNEVVARLRRLLARIDDYSYTFAPKERIDDRLSVDLSRGVVFVEECEVHLTPTETKLLFLLMRSAGRTIQTSYIINRLWPLENVFEEALRVHIHRLRHKIEQNPSKPRYIKTQRGEGYRFIASGRLAA